MCNLRLIHVVVRQKPTQNCKAVILQLKKKRNKAFLGPSWIWGQWMAFEALVPAWLGQLGRKRRVLLHRGARKRKSQQNKRLIRQRGHRAIDSKARPPKL